jgi:hypothetical protein
MNIDQIYDLLLCNYGYQKFIELHPYDKENLLKLTNMDKYLTDDYWFEEDGLYKYDDSEAEFKRSEFAKKYNYRKLYIIAQIYHVLCRINDEEEMVNMLNFAIIKSDFNRGQKLTQDATILDFAAIFESATIKQLLITGI